MLDRIQRWLVMACGATAILAGSWTMWETLVHFLVSHQTEIIMHIVMGVMFTLTGVYLRNMCEHLRHKVALGAVLITAEAILTVAVIG